jgi:hypothetical protein
VKVRLVRSAALGPQLAQVDLVAVDPGSPARAPHVVDRRRSGDPEQPRLERARPLEPAERLVGTDHGVAADVFGITAPDDRRHIGDQAVPLLVDDDREDRVEIGGR